MDSWRAATRGKLTICQNISGNGRVGCSSVAFVGAAANGHFHVVEWLHRNYPEFRGTVDDIVSAARNGHTRVVEFLHRIYGLDVISLAAEAAAANGHVAVLDILRFQRRMFNLRKHFTAAAANGRVGVMRFILEEFNWHGVCGMDTALKVAVQNDQIEAMEMLFGLCRSYAKDTALKSAAQNGSVDMITRMLALGTFEGLQIGFALQEAVKCHRCDLVGRFLEKLPHVNIALKKIKFEKEYELAVAIRSALVKAVESGRVALVRPLLDWSASVAPSAFHTAVNNTQWEIAKFVLSSYDTEDVNDPFLVKGNYETAAKYAAAEGDVEMAQVLKVYVFEGGQALKIAVESDHLDIVKIFIDRSSTYFKVNALVSAASSDRIEILQYLLDHCDQDTVNDVFTRVALAGNFEVSKLLLTKCSAGAHVGLFKHAAEFNLVHMVRFLVDDTSTCAINRGIIAAAAKCNTEVVKLLLDKCDALSLNYALEVAAVDGQLGTVRLLQDRCDSAGILAAEAKARAVGCNQVVQLLRSKRARLS